MVSGAGQGLSHRLLGTRNGRNCLKLHLCLQALRTGPAFHEADNELYDAGEESSGGSFTPIACTHIPAMVVEEYSLNAVWGGRIKAEAEEAVEDHSATAVTHEPGEAIVAHRASSRANHTVWGGGIKAEPGEEAVEYHSASSVTMTRLGEHCHAICPRCSWHFAGDVNCKMLLQHVQTSHPDEEESLTAHIQWLYKVGPLYHCCGGHGPTK